MARLVLGAVGAAVGFYLGGPAGASMGWSIGSAIGGAVDPDDPIKQSGPRLGDLKVQFSSYGAMMPIVYGTMRIAGNVIWASGLKESSKTESAGGKGGGGGSETTTYSYSIDMAVSLCEGPIVGVRRVWANGELVYNFSANADVNTVNASQDGAKNFTIYTGSESQLADPTMEAALGVGNVPGYRGQAYIVFDDLQLEKYGNRVPNLEFEVVVGGTFVRPSFVDTGLPAYMAGGNFERVGKFGEVWCISNAGYTRMARYNLRTGVRMVERSWSSGLGGVLGLGSPSDNGEILCRRLWTSTWYMKLLSDGTEVEVFEPDGITPLLNMSDSTFGIGSDETHYMGTPLGYIGIDSVTGRWTGYQQIPVGFTMPFGSVTQIPCGAARGAGITVLMRPNGGPTPNAQVGRVMGGTYSLLFVAINATRMELDADGNIYTGNQTAQEIKRYARGTTVASHTLSLPGYQGDLLVIPHGKGLMLTEYNITPGTPSTKRIALIDLATLTIVSTAPFYHVAGASLLETMGSEVGAIINNTLHLCNYAGALSVTDDQSSAPLNAIVSDLCTRSGLTSINATPLTELVRGYAINRQTTARANIEPLQRAYFFDAVESDGTLKFVKRGGAVAVTIPLDELGAYEDGGQPTDPIITSRSQEVDLPNVVNINFPNVDNAFQISTESARRLLTASKQQVTQEVAVAMTPTLAAKIADVLLYDAHIARTTFAFDTTRKYAKYEPTDIVTVIGPNITYNVRLVKKDESGPLIKWQAVAEDTASYASLATPTNTIVAPINVATGGPTNLLLLDIPLLLDADNDAGLYASLNGYVAGWTGATILQSADDVNFLSTKSAFSGAATGLCTTILGAGLNTHMCDEVSSVTVKVVNATLASTTFDLMLNGTNMALVGNEIIAFRDATLIAADTYTLRGLLRSLYGTNQHQATHVASERFVLLTTSGLVRLPLTTQQLNVTQYYKAVTFGQTQADAVTKNFINTGVGLKPLSPVHLGGGKQPNGDFIIKWVRRGRLDSAWRSLADVPVGETIEQYSVELMTTGNVVRRTVTVNTATTITYTAAEQTADGGALLAGQLNVRIYQISAAIGRGFPSVITNF